MFSIKPGNIDLCKYLAANLADSFRMDLNLHWYRASYETGRDDSILLSFWLIRNNFCIKTMVQFEFADYS